MEERSKETITCLLCKAVLYYPKSNPKPAYRYHDHLFLDHNVMFEADRLIDISLKFQFPKFESKDFIQKTVGTDVGVQCDPPDLPLNLTVNCDSPLPKLKSIDSMLEPNIKEEANLETKIKVDLDSPPAFKVKSEKKRKKKKKGSKKKGNKKGNEDEEKQALLEQIKQLPEDCKNWVKTLMRPRLLCQVCEKKLHNLDKFEFHISTSHDLSLAKYEKSHKLNKEECYLECKLCRNSIEQIRFPAHVAKHHEYKLSTYYEQYIDKSTTESSSDNDKLSDTEQQRNGEEIIKHDQKEKLENSKIEEDSPIDIVNESIEDRKSTRDISSCDMSKTSQDSDTADQQNTIETNSNDRKSKLRSQKISDEEEDMPLKINRRHKRITREQKNRNSSEDSSLSTASESAEPVAPIALSKHQKKISEMKKEGVTQHAKPATTGDGGIYDRIKRRRISPYYGDNEEVDDKSSIIQEIREKMLKGAYHEPNSNASIQMNAEPADESAKNKRKHIDNSHGNMETDESSRKLRQNKETHGEENTTAVEQIRKSFENSFDKSGRALRNSPLPNGKTLDNQPSEFKKEADGQAKYERFINGFGENQLRNKMDKYLNKGENDDNQNGKLSCNPCSTTFSTIRHMQFHQYTVHGKKPNEDEEQHQNEPQIPQASKPHQTSSNNRKHRKKKEVFEEESLNDKEGANVEQGKGEAIFVQDGKFPKPFPVVKKEKSEGHVLSSQNLKKEPLNANVEEGNSGDSGDKEQTPTNNETTLNEDTETTQENNKTNKEEEQEGRIEKNGPISSEKVQSDLKTPKKKKGGNKASENDNNKSSKTPKKIEEIVPTKSNKKGKSSVISKQTKRERQQRESSNENTSETANSESSSDKIDKISPKKRLDFGETTEGKNSSEEDNTDNGNKVKATKELPLSDKKKKKGSQKSDKKEESINEEIPSQSDKTLETPRTEPPAPSNDENNQVDKNQERTADNCKEDDVDDMELIPLKELIIKETKCHCGTGKNNVGQKRKMPCKKCKACLAPKCGTCPGCAKPSLKKPCVDRTCLFPKIPKCPCFTTPKDVVADTKEDKRSSSASRSGSASRNGLSSRASSVNRSGSVSRAGSANRELDSEQPSNVPNDPKTPKKKGSVSRAGSVNREIDSEQPSKAPSDPKTPKKKEEGNEKKSRGRPSKIPNNPKTPRKTGDDQENSNSEKSNSQFHPKTPGKLENNPSQQRSDQYKNDNSANVQSGNMENNQFQNNDKPKPGIGLSLMEQFKNRYPSPNGLTNGLSNFRNLRQNFPSFPTSTPGMPPSIINDNNSSSSNNVENDRPVATNYKEMYSKMLNMNNSNLSLSDLRNQMNNSRQENSQTQAQPSFNLRLGDGSNGMPNLSLSNLRTQLNNQQTQQSPFSFNLRPGEGNSPASSYLSNIRNQLGDGNSSTSTYLSNLRNQMGDNTSSPSNYLSNLRNQMGDNTSSPTNYLSNLRNQINLGKPSNFQLPAKYSMNNNDGNTTSGLSLSNLRNQFNLPPRPGMQQTISENGPPVQDNLQQPINQPTEVEAKSQEEATTNLPNSTENNPQNVEGVASGA